MSLWDDHHTLIVKSVAERAEGLAWMHYKSSRLFASIENCISLVSFLCSIFICAFSFSQLSCQYAFFHWLLGSVGAFSTFLSILHKTLEPGSMCEKHFHAFNGYSSIYRQSSNELSLVNSMRSPVHEVLTKIHADYEHLANYSPFVPDIIVNRYKRVFSHKKIKPEIANGFSEIVVAESS